MATGAPPGRGPPLPCAKGAGQGPESRRLLGDGPLLAANLGDFRVQLRQSGVDSHQRLVARLTAGRAGLLERRRPIRGGRLGRDCFLHPAHVVGDATTRFVRFLLSPGQIVQAGPHGLIVAALGASPGRLFQRLLRRRQRLFPKQPEALLEDQPTQAGRQQFRCFAGGEAAHRTNAAAAGQAFQHAIHGRGGRRQQQYALAPGRGLRRDLGGGTRFSGAGMPLNQAQVRRLQRPCDGVALVGVEGGVAAFDGGWAERRQIVRLSVKEDRQYGEPGCVSARSRRPVAGGELVGVKHPLPPGQFQQLTAPRRRKRRQQVLPNAAGFRPSQGGRNRRRGGDAFGGVPFPLRHRASSVAVRGRGTRTVSESERAIQASHISARRTEQRHGPRSYHAVSRRPRLLIFSVRTRFPLSGTRPRAGGRGGDEPNGRTKPSVRCGKQLSYGGVGSYVSILARPCLSSSSGEGRGSRSRTAPVKTVNRDDLVSGTRLPVRSRPPRS